MTPTATQILEVDGVSKAFGALRAVDAISVEVREGEVVALLGPNGAGKTTLLRMVIGMLRPDEGRIRYRFDGRAADQPDPERLGYLPEERGLYQDVSVKRVLLYFAALRGVPRAEASREAERWLERLGLGERAGEQMRNLSKGNQQKVQFISSVIHRPSLAVLDEPFSGLDPLNQDFFLELIRELREGGTTVVFSAHQMQLVERLADRVVMIRRGRIADQGTVDELRQLWGAGRKLRLRVDGDANLSFLESHPGVRAVGRTGGQIEVTLATDTALSPLLASIGRHLNVRDLQTESTSLHDIYVRSVGERDAQTAPEAES